MSLGFSQAFKDYEQALRSRQRYIWHSDLQFLGCYSDEFYARFNGDNLQLVYFMLHPQHIVELGFPHEVSRTNHAKPLALKILCFEYVLIKGTLLSKRDEIGSVPAVGIMDDIETWVSENSESINPEYALLCRTFLEEETVSIPSIVWKKVLGIKK